MSRLAAMILFGSTVSLSLSLVTANADALCMRMPPRPAAYDEAVRQMRDGKPEAGAALLLGGAQLAHRSWERSFWMRRAVHSAAASLTRENRTLDLARLFRVAAKSPPNIYFARRMLAAYAASGHPREGLESLRALPANQRNDRMILIAAAPLAAKSGDRQALSEILVKLRAHGPLPPEIRHIEESMRGTRFLPPGKLGQI
jgi:hypothetical protein